MFPTILDIKNGNKTLKNLVEKLSQNSKKDRMTRFNISVTVKRRRDNYVSVHLRFSSSIYVLRLCNLYLKLTLLLTDSG